jgi:hypothetical protein
MRWVFIRPRNESPYYDPEVQEPLGLEYLAASRRSHGDMTLILDVVLDGVDEPKLGRRAAAFQPDFVGFSITTAQELDSVGKIFEQCQRATSGPPITWLAGGNFVSTELPRALTLLPDNFVLVPFEGENALQEVAEMRRGNPPNSNGLPPTDRVCRGRAVADIDALPFPLRPFADQILQAGWAFSLQSSRGCCGCCRFCASPGMAADGVNRWRGRSPESLVEEMASLQQCYGAASFNLIDEDFLGPPALATSRASRFAKEVQRRDLRLSFGIQVRPSSLNDDAINSLTSVGLTYVFMGLESDDPEDLRRWGRPRNVNPWRCIQQLRERGAGVNAGVMLFHSHSTFAGIRRFASTLHDHGLLEFRSALNRMDAMPGSVYYRQALEADEISRAVTGPQPLPFRDPDVARLHEELALAIEPLGPPSMHATCCLPPLLAQRTLDGRLAPRIQQLREINFVLDEAVARSLFTLLDLHQHAIGPGGLVESLRQQNFGTALSASTELHRHGFAPSYDALREAIRKDSGM